ncbi:hypothetical protein DFJ74DRAFT_650250 [Hyaloraphidium curvatum]|nr:hypothetical protein DFJ74DRAFT_650250 [Hyaloraphidium curvatum]
MAAPDAAVGAGGEPGRAAPADPAPPAAPPSAPGSPSEIQAPSSHPADASHSLPPPHIVFAGGSIGACLGAVAVLTAAPAAKVTVLERAPGLLREEGGGIVLQEQLYRFYSSHGMSAKPSDVGVPVLGRKHVARDGSLEAEQAYPQIMTGWDVLYRAARKRAEELGARYLTGKTVVGFEIAKGEDGDVVLVDVESAAPATESSGELRRDDDWADGELGSAEHVPSAVPRITERIPCDLLVGSDGASSTIRRCALPDEGLARLRYAGYVAFRGLLPFSTLPPDLSALVRSSFAVYTSSGRPHTSMLAYPIPGTSEGGGPPAFDEAHQRVNYVWYWRVPRQPPPGDPTPSLEEVLTDRRGHVHRSSVPPGLLHPEVYPRILALARAHLPPPFAALVELSGPDATFVQGINDLPAPPLTFAGGRVVLSGDAGCVVRPHTGAGTMKCAEDATALATVVRAWAARRAEGVADGDGAWLEERMGEDYDGPRVARHAQLAKYGVALGDRLLGFERGLGPKVIIAPEWK